MLTNKTASRSPRPSRGSRLSFYAMYAAVDGMLIAIAGVSTWLVPATLIAVSTGGIAGRISVFYTGVTACHDIDSHRRVSRKTQL